MFGKITNLVALLVVNGVVDGGGFLHVRNELGGLADDLNFAVGDPTKQNEEKERHFDSNHC